MRILFADDHDLLRDMIVAYLEAEDGIDVEQAASFEEACAKIETGGRYDLVLLDYKMPGMRGLDSLEKALTLDGRDQRVAIISGEASREIAEKALAMGAAGFVPKTLAAKSLVSAIKFMAMGEQYAPIQFMTAEAERESHPIVDKLTQRETEVLKGVFEGKSNKEIARDLDLTEPTIKLHMKTLFRKLDVKNRTQAALLAKEEEIF
ncbi:MULTISPECIES: response regulator [unclassified Roseivivax]|uniref:response regulator n=1 Tax=Roseivivax sp. GX 12232 TaxID=2900547 RepID=UPI001E5223EB|nr:response regulator transcription factor [Roseivivax sp. GX 12232]